MSLLPCLEWLPEHSCNFRPSSDLQMGGGGAYQHVRNPTMKALQCLLAQEKKIFHDCVFVLTHKLWHFAP